MKRKDILITSAIFLVSMAFAVNATSLALLNRHVVELPRLTLGAKTYVAQDKCSDDQMRNLTTSDDNHLVKLAEYESICNSGFFTSAMLFIDMPKDKNEAVQKGTELAAVLKKFDNYKVRPIVIWEPVTSWGSIDFSEFRSGFYNRWLEQFIVTLKDSGVTEEQMGVWVPFPEANLPYWNHQNSKPDDFAANVTITAKIIKKHYPKSHVSVLLNSATYETDDFDWARGDYISLRAYVKGIPKGLISSFGYQGLPWAPPANQAGASVMDTNEYLNPQLAIEAAETLGVKDIWLNTGTFSRKFTLDEGHTITIEPEKRKDILNGVLQQAAHLQNKGFNVSINLFSEDKSQLKEATDWSYWPVGAPGATPDSAVFVEFAKSARKQNVQLWLFDRKR